MPSWRKALRRTTGRPLSGSIEDFVVITGFSGAGKSQAMACFEDAGYFCVDNLPPEMILSLADLFQHEGSKVERAAVVSDVRGGEFFEGLVEVLDELEERGTDYRLLFLDASEEELVNRYKETRRRHPLASGGEVAGGIHQERELLEPLRERADVRIDTTDMSASRLRRGVADKMHTPETEGKLAITFLTYGFKHGTPREADLSFDVRFLPNPHYVKEGKSHLTIGIGCTGGRHRSVVIAEHLARAYGERDDLLVDVVHRDVDKPPRRP